MRLRRFLQAALAAMLAGIAGYTAAGAALTPAEWIDQYFSRLSTWSADFEQTVTGDSSGSPRTGSGRLYLQKPGRFRWDYLHPTEQLVLADGRKLWFYDKDLAQVTVRDMDSTLASTPAVLLSSGAPVSAEFEIRALPDSDGLVWYELRPRDKNSDFLAVRLGFSRGELHRMLIADKLNQVTRLDFSKEVRNRPLSGSLFTFTVPAGVDVIGSGEGSR